MADIEDLFFETERRARHARACLASDIQVLREGLESAAARFADLAAAIERDGKYDGVAFLRASAERYQRLSGLPRRLW